MSGGFVGDGAARTGRGIKEAVLTVAPVKSDRTADTQPSDDASTVNDHAVDTVAASSSPGGTKPMGNPILHHMQELTSIANNYDLSTDANLYGLVDAAPVTLESVAEVLEILAERGRNENAKTTATACEDLGVIAKSIRESAVVAYEIREFLFKSREYMEYMEKLDDRNGGTSDVSRARGQAY
jgi:hypothetical protein